MGVINKKLFILRSHGAIEVTSIGGMENQKGWVLLGHHDVEIPMPDVDEKELAIESLQSQAAAIDTKAQSEVEDIMAKIEKLKEESE